MSEQANANDNVSFERQAFLDFHELLLEAGAATECDYLIVLYHCLFAIICLFDKLEFMMVQIYHSALAFVGIGKRVGTDKHKDTGGVEVCVIQDSGILQLNMKTVTLVEGDASACDVISRRLHFPDYRQIALFPQESQRQCAQTLVTVDVKRSQIQEITTYA